MKGKRQSPRHTFIFKADGSDAAPIKAKAKVIKARKPVTLVLKAQHVRESMKRHGIGNTQTCSMAICASHHAAHFPHAVIGYFDWLYSRLFVASKARNGLPSVCVEYVHRDGIARMNDTPGGQRKLLAELERDGDRKVRLYPVRKNYNHGHTPPGHQGEQDGSRGVRLRGARLRFAVAQLGGVPA